MIFEHSELVSLQDPDIVISPTPLTNATVWPLKRMRWVDQRSYDLVYASRYQESFTGKQEQVCVCVTLDCPLRRALSLCLAVWCCPARLRLLILHAV